MKIAAQTTVRTTTYSPAKDFFSRVKRRILPLQAQRKVNFKLDKPIISFSFDDCPQSVIENGIKPLEAQGWRSSVYVAMGLCNTTNHLGLHMSEEDVVALHKSGHEIGDHTYSHCDGSAMPIEEFLEDIDKNQATLQALGLPPSQTFAYPYGQATPALKRAVETRFIGARGIDSRNHITSADLNQIGSNRLYRGGEFNALIGQITDLRARPAWITIFTHDIREKPSHYGCTPEQMLATIEAVKKSGATVLTIADAIKYVESRHET